MSSGLSSRITMGSVDQPRRNIGDRRLSGALFKMLIPSMAKEPYKLSKDDFK